MAGPDLSLVPRLRLTQRATTASHAKQKKSQKPKLEPLQVDPDLKERVVKYAALEGKDVKDVVREAFAAYGLNKKLLGVLQREQDDLKESG